MEGEKSSPAERSRLYSLAVAEFSDSLARMARAYERNAEARRDLLQDVQIALWNSFASYDARCSLRTWVYRVAHNIGAKHVLKQMRVRASLHVSLDEADCIMDERSTTGAADDQHALARILVLLQSLRTLDRQLMLLYLEDLDAATISEITGLSARNVATKIHRIKQLLAERFNQGVAND